MKLWYMANESVTHHKTSTQNGWFCKSTKTLNPNHRKQMKLKAKKLFEKIQNLNFNLSIQKKFFNCSCTYSSVFSNSPLIFHFQIKYFVICQVIWMEEPIDTISIKKFEKSPKHFAKKQIKMLLRTILFLKNKQNKCY